jgi:hypothetical protein
MREGASSLDFADTLYETPPLSEALFTWRHPDGTVVTNVPHLVAEHSPTGYEFGYGGSGPADLALNVVEALLRDVGFAGVRMACWRGSCFRLSYQVHQRFKRKFIEPMDRDGGRIPRAEMVRWLQEHTEGEEGCPF